MSDDVKRYKVEGLNCCFDADMIESPNGEYVEYADYAKLKAEGDWRPISTYRGGNWAYLFVPLDNIPGNYIIVEGCFMVGLKKWWVRSWQGTDQDAYIKPTHWMPLFTPPEVGD